jgi:hypothetical protein
MIEPPFWDHALSKIPFCDDLLTQYPKIFKELSSFISKNHPFMNYPKYGNLYSHTWEAFPLSIFEGEFIALTKGQLGFDLDSFVKEARRHLPQISALISTLESEGHCAMFLSVVLCRALKFILTGDGHLNFCVFILVWYQIHFAN